MPFRLYRALDRREIAVLLVALGVLAGLIGMHVLGLHGVHRAASAAIPPGAAHLHGSAVAGEHPPAVHVPGAEASSTDVAAVSGCCDHEPGASGVALCLALLVVIGVLAALVQGGRSRPAPPRPRTARAGPWSLTSRARAGPPYVMAFSVVRC